MKRSNMTVRPTIIALNLNPFRDVRGRALSHRVDRRFLLGPILLVLVLIMLGSACRKQPAAEEIKGPILGMMTATGFDDKGQPQNPSFAFAPTEPQLVVIVQVGKLDSGGQASSASWIQLETVASAADDPVVNIAWYQTSDESEQKLFEHQVKVQSYDRAYSIGKSKGTLKAGSYKVRATLAGQTQEVPLQVHPPKADASSGTSPQLQVTAASSDGSWQGVDQGDLPVPGESGTIARPSGASSTGDPGHEEQRASAEGGYLRIEAFVGEDFTDYRQNTVDAWVLPYRIREDLDGPETGHSDDLLGEVTATVTGPAKHLGTFTGRANISIRNLLDGRDQFSFGVDPCTLAGGSDLPDSTVTFEAMLKRGEQVVVRDVEVIKLGKDSTYPELRVKSNPRAGKKVKAGDVIKIEATASETRSGGPWQTGVQRVQLTSPERLIEEWTHPSRLPAACDKKSWSQVLKGSYKVPNKPPPVIKLCAIAEDYAGNENFKCGEFPTGDVWEGTLNTDVTVASPAVSCTGGKWQAKIKIVAGEDGTASGDITVVDASKSSCSSGGAGGPYAIVGSKSPITAVVNDAGFTFPLSQFMGRQVQGSTFIQKSGRNQASGTATPSYSFGGGLTNSFVMTFKLECKTCAP